MNLGPDLRRRLQRLTTLARKELQHLRITDERLFSSPFDAQRAASLDSDVELSERVDAFHIRPSLGAPVNDCRLPAPFAPPRY